jgi:predicted transcriptional regulator of viral defense system
MITRNIKLGANELRLLFTLEEENGSVFSINDAKRILKTSTPSVWNVIYRLKRKGRIEEIEKGKYLLIPARAGYKGSWSEVPYLLVPNIISAYYIGFWTALNYWGMTEQVPNVIFVATTKRKKDVEFGDTRYEFVTLTKKRFFGYVEENTTRGTFNISSREKTIIDCMLFPKYCGGLDESIKGIWKSRKELDFVKLLEYSNRMEVSVVTRRIGYALELLGLAEEISSQIASCRSKGYMWLDSLGPKEVIEYSKKYGLLINRKKDELTGWMEY